jgi:hypothetical protein
MREVARRIGQLIRLLSSDHPGEAGAAAQALNRTLTSAGLDIHELAKVAEVGLKLPAEQPVRRRREAREARTTTHRRPDGGLLVVGQGLICDQPTGPFRACACGGVLFTIKPGVGPHRAQLVCDGCRRGGRWLACQYFNPPPPT